MGCPNERAGEGREGIRVVLILQTAEDITNTGALTTIEVAATIHQDAKIVRAGKVVGIGKVKAVDDILDFEAEVVIAVRV